MAAVAALTGFLWGLDQPHIRSAAVAVCAAQLVVALFQSLIYIEIGLHIGADRSMHDGFDRGVVFRREIIGEFAFQRVVETKL